MIAASLGLMASVTWLLGRAALVDLHTVIIAAGAAAVLLVWRPNATWLILGGAAAGWILSGGG